MKRGIGCASCPANKDCDSQYRGSSCAVKRAKAGADFDPETIGDTISRMKVEELAKFLSTTFCHGFGETEILKWLKTPCRANPENP